VTLTIGNEQPNTKMLTKSKLVQVLADRTNLSKQQANLLLENLSDIVEEQLKSEGVFALPNLVKFTLKDKPATPERTGINPFTKAPITIPAKAASKKIRASVIGELKKFDG
jgi:DNA-binding protein HU-beta